MSIIYNLQIVRKNVTYQLMVNGKQVFNILSYTTNKIGVKSS